MEVNAKEFRKNMKKYFDIAEKESLDIIRGNVVYTLAVKSVHQASVNKESVHQEDNKSVHPKETEDQAKVRRILSNESFVHPPDNEWVKVNKIPYREGEPYGGYEKCEDQPFDPEKGIFRKDVYGRTFVPVQWMDRDEGGKVIPEVKGLVKASCLIK